MRCKGTNLIYKQKENRLCLLSSHICRFCILRIQGEVNTNEGIPTALKSSWGGFNEDVNIADTCMNASRGVPIKAC